MAVKRFDSSVIGPGVVRTPQGGLRIPARPTRAGVLVYRNADGSERREFRPPEEVFHADSLASLKGATLTDLHPGNPDGVTSDNWKQLSVGHVGEDVCPDGYHVAATILVQDATTIGLINSGQRKELSCGYSCDVVDAEGVWDGVPYTQRQENIRYNHVALGPHGWGRGGSSVALRLDAGDAVSVDYKSVSTIEDHRMKTVRVDGIEYEAGSEAHLQAVEKRHAAQEAKIGTESARADSAEKSAKDSKEALSKATDPKLLAAKVRARADMLDKGRRVAAIKGVRFDDAAEPAADEGGDQGVMIQILKMIQPDFNPAGKSPEFLSGYAMASINALLASAGEEEVETLDADPAKVADPSNPGMTPPAAPGRSDSRGGNIYDARGQSSRDDGASESTIRGSSASRNDATEAEARMHKDCSEAWQQPLHFSKDRR